MKIIIDAGHGGRDPGCIGSGTMEKTQNLAMALTLKFELLHEGHSVLLTRGSDKYPTWAERTYLQPEADIYVALHMDSVNGRTAIYYATRTLSSDWKNGYALGSKLRAELQKTDPETQLFADTVNRHGRLYIQDVRAKAAILWEVDPIHKMETNERIFRSHQFISALYDYQALTAATADAKKELHT